MNSIDEGGAKDLLRGIFIVITSVTPSIILADKVFNIVEQSNDLSDCSFLSNVVVHMPLRLSKTNSMHKILLLPFFDCTPRLKDLQLLLQLRNSSSLPGL